MFNGCRYSGSNVLATLPQVGRMLSPLVKRPILWLPTRPSLSASLPAPGRLNTQAMSSYLISYRQSGPSGRCWTLSEGRAAKLLEWLEVSSVWFSGGRLLGFPTQKGVRLGLFEQFARASKDLASLADDRSQC